MKSRSLYRKLNAAALLLFALWIIGFKTIHVLTAPDHHHHGCSHNEAEVPQEDSEDCFICDWTFPLFQEPEVVSVSFRSLPVEVDCVSLYFASVCITQAGQTANKAPPVC